MRFRVGQARKSLSVRDLVIAGWTGRDRDAVLRHMRELEALGVAPPRSVPVFYRVGRELLTTAPSIDVAGSDSSGEVEFVLLAARDGLYVGVGSDHTDRKVETYGVTVSKQMCPKPIAPEIWRFDAVERHWERLVIRAHVTRGGTRVLYQEGPVTTLLDPRDLVQRYTGGGPLPAGTALFGGTLPALGEIGGGETFEIELDDPVRRRRLRHAYAVRVLTLAQ